MNGAVLIEGHAALNDRPDQIGDVIRAGAFAASLRALPQLPMLLQHRRGAIAGRWTRVSEDGMGLYVRGLVDAPAALTLIRRGLDGLSIGFRARTWRQLPGGGRELVRVDLVEISLVAEPMQTAARFRAALPLEVAA